MSQQWLWEVVSVPQQEPYYNYSNVSPNATYGLQEALSIGDGTPFSGYTLISEYLDTNRSYPYDDQDDFVLFNDTCPQSGCMNTCEGDFATMFMNNGLQTLHNCNLLPNLAIRYPEDAAVSSVYPSDTNLAITAIHVANTLLGCLKSICDSLTTCRGFDLVSNLTSFNASSMWNLTKDYSADGYSKSYLSILVESICDTSLAQVNADLGGIGVYISYWIQSGLALLGFLATIFWILLVPYIYVSLIAFRHGPKDAWKQMNLARSRVQKQGSPLVAALVELHKSQCLFMMATNIAAIVVRTRGGLNPQSLQTIYENTRFITTIALNGILPITFTMFNLHLIDMMDWYLVVLSCLTIALSILTLVLFGRFTVTESDREYLGQIASQGGPLACGGIQPQVYCYYRDSFLERDVGEVRFVLSFSLLVLLLVIASKLKVEQSKIYRRGSAWTLRLLCLLCTGNYRFVHLQRFRGAKFYVSRIATSSFKRIESIFSRRFINSIAVLLEAFPTHDQASWKGRVWKCFVSISYTVIFILYVILFKRLLKDLISFEFSHQWNFGQVVALTVWLPPLFELAHLEIRGMPKGFKHRLLPPYRVTTEPPPQREILEIEDHINNQPIRSTEDLRLQLLSNSQAPGIDHQHPIAGEETMGSQYHREETTMEYHLGDGMNFRSVRGRSISPIQPATEPASSSTWTPLEELDLSSRVEYYMRETV